ncbi:putative pre-16S rRNA nuclease [Spiroplasma sp. JKS002669]|uniref:Holliday junction resolvase RuvX n=1 Tax=Spiroplasma attinicola TaxID=2904537 RepID=UPI002022F6A3|nr:MULTISPECIES: Holliday junction resolvase RuvX [unclassified Spiroplasma]MCL6429171.1 putative pre-16S rRNA nuclease [Spiroplasma sp. JKS002669]MCL8209509.1 putative pre-16S rRNA nuclease [Spiroplasma sp. JKS002670]MCL8210327.1 putative pre-16S rRNA nuclease [Spiroplasma sp. JKS002671]
MKYLGIDLGSKTLGLATGTGIIASPWKTLRFKEHDFDLALDMLLMAIGDYQPNEVIIGYPLNMDGSVGESAQVVLEFKKLLENKVSKDLTVVLFDERRTTFSANQALIQGNVKRAKRKELKDQLAATIILQTYFDKLKFEFQGR